MLHQNEKNGEFLQCKNIFIKKRTLTFKTLHFSIQLEFLFRLISNQMNKLLMIKFTKKIDVLKLIAAQSSHAICKFWLAQYRLADLQFQTQIHSKNLLQQLLKQHCATFLVSELYPES